VLPLPTALSTEALPPCASTKWRAIASPLPPVLRLRDLSARQNRSKTCGRRRNWHAVPGTSGVVGTGSVHTYTVEVEDGVETPGGDAEFGAAVQATLADPRSWIGGGDVAVRRVDSGQPDLRVRLASRNTARARCGFEIPVDVSCRDGGNVYLGGARWVRGAVAFDGDLASYRQYMVNHEVGHHFGKSHRPCTVHGGPAPVMMQQTFSTSNDDIAKITAGVPQGTTVPRDGKVCAPNPWPFP
jgi:hypothetical protein